MSFKTLMTAACVYVKASSAGLSGWQRYYVLGLSVRSSIYKTCEYNILKMSELILMLFTGKRQRSALGTRRSKIEVTQGRRWILEALVDASVSTCLGQVAFFSLAAAINC